MAWHPHPHPPPGAHFRSRGRHGTSTIASALAIVRGVGACARRAPSFPAAHSLSHAARPLVGSHRRACVGSRQRTTSRSIRSISMENFFKRKDPPPGAPAGGPNPKTACTSSTSPSSSSAPRWSTHHDALLARTEAACAPCAKIAAFDLDDTLQKTRSGQKGYMVTDVNDFVDWSADVAPTLRRLHATGYKIVIFSNQGGVKGAMTGKRADVVRRRIDAFARAAGVPLQAFCATQKGVDKDPRSYRKPGAGMWKLATSAAFNDGVEVNVAECFFVGDAAGRAGDFSASDKEFAAGAGVRFMTPEEAFNAPGCAPAGPGGGGGREDGEGAAEDANTKMESAVCAKEGGEGVIVIDDDDDEVDKKMASLRDDTP